MCGCRCGRGWVGGFCAFLSVFYVSVDVCVCDSVAVCLYVCGFICV